MQRTTTKKDVSRGKIAKTIDKEMSKRRRTIDNQEK